MKVLPVSQKYQVVIPKAARKVMGITPLTKGLYIKHVSKDEIVLVKAPQPADWLRELLESTPQTKTNAVQQVRKLRSEWDQ